MIKKMQQLNMEVLQEIRVLIVMERVGKTMGFFFIIN